VAHRGYPHRYPENTLVGIEAALKLGASWIEVDVQLSGDREPVLFHDRDLQRICGVPGTVRKHVLSALRELRAAHREKFGETFGDVPIATLDELVALLGRYPEAKTFVEIKPIAVEQFGADVVVGTVIERLSSLAGRCVLISFALDAILEARRRGWTALGLILSEWSHRALSHATDLEVDYVLSNVRRMPWLGSIAHAGLRVAVYDVIEPRRAERWVRRGADLVETFAIGEMLERFGGPKAPSAA